MKIYNKNFIIIAVIFLSFFIDISSKFFISRNFVQGQPVNIIGKYVRITYIYNYGAAFGTFQNAGKKFNLITLSAIILIIYFFFHLDYTYMMLKIGAGLILGGAFGNFLNRLFFGKVVDFIDCEFPDIQIPAFSIPFKKPDLIIFIYIGVLIIIVFLSIISVLVYFTKKNSLKNMFLNIKLYIEKYFYIVFFLELGLFLIYKIWNFDGYELTRWPVFNLADAMILTGAFMLFYKIFQIEKKEKNNASNTSDNT